MNTVKINHARIAGILVFATAVSFLVASCATAPQNPPGSAEVRSKLTALQSNSSLADQVPVELREAEAAVLAAEAPVGNDVALGAHRVYMADRKVEIATARASTRYAEDQRAELSQARDDARLNARTQEADRARRETATAQSATDAALASAAVAAKEADELQRQIDVLQAEATDRGLVLTLGDVLFGTGRSDLTSGGTNTLDKLVVFLNNYPDRNVVIEGHTDDVGRHEMNQTLSQHRADSVKFYLVQQGIRHKRLAASGMGETQPIADNQSPSGRQQNRRVEVIINNPQSVVPAASTN
jgi:outer membrane protein OmpA-like peptidoglycan-associated protein